MKVELTYFRAWNGPGGLGGKYYSEGELELELSHSQVVDEVERLRNLRRLPGLTEGHGDYHVLVTTEPESVPHLLVAPHFQNPRERTTFGAPYDVTLADVLGDAGARYTLMHVFNEKPWLVSPAESVADMKWSDAAEEARQLTAEEAARVVRHWPRGTVQLVPARDAQHFRNPEAEVLTDKQEGATKLTAAREPAPRFVLKCTAIGDKEPWLKSFNKEGPEWSSSREDAEQFTPEEAARIAGLDPGAVEVVAATQAAATSADAVDHPRHYNAHPSGVECIDVVEHMSFCAGNAVKYLWRAGLKTEDPTEDLRKAAWYASREAERVEKLRNSK